MQPDERGMMAADSMDHPRVVGFWQLEAHAPAKVNSSSTQQQVGTVMQELTDSRLPELGMISEFQKGCH